MKTCRTAMLVGLPMLSAALAGCRQGGRPVESPHVAVHPQEAYFQANPANSGSIHGLVRYLGPHPPARKIDMTQDPACVKAHAGTASDDSLVVGQRAGLANAFVYIASGLEGKRFAVPSAPVVIDQRGCWFRPRVLGLQTGQTLQIVNSDPVTHNIHPMAAINREWNHSQGPGDPPVDRHFGRPELMIPVKCNIHSWMRAYIGVLDNPYFAVTNDDGSFTLPDLPPGRYLLRVWQEKLGTKDAAVSVSAGEAAEVSLTFKPK